MEGRALKEILKPTTGKLVMFLVLMLLITILPLYPIHYDARAVFDGHEENTSGTKLEALVFVIQGDFEWSEREDNPSTAIILDWSWLYTDYDYSANPAYLALYIPYTILTYIAGCFLAEYLAWWKNKNENIKQIKDF